MLEVRPIDANALLKKVYDNPPEKARMTQGEWCRKCIYEAPTIKPELRYGSWKIIDYDANVWECTTCGEEWMLNDGNPSDNNMLFCPHCGSRMCGGDDNG